MLDGCFAYALITAETNQSTGATAIAPKKSSLIIGVCDTRHAGIAAFRSPLVVRQLQAMKTIMLVFHGVTME